MDASEATVPTPVQQEDGNFTLDAWPGDRASTIDESEGGVGAAGYDTPFSETRASTPPYRPSGTPNDERFPGFLQTIIGFLDIVDNILGGIAAVQTEEITPSLHERFDPLLQGYQTKCSEYIDALTRHRHDGFAEEIYQRSCATLKDVTSNLIRFNLKPTREVQRDEPERLLVLEQATKPEVPTFSGQRADWHVWWSHFQELVVKNNRMTECLKYQTLVKSVKGKAKMLVGDRLWVPGLFSKVTELLVRHYKSDKRDVGLMLRQLRQVNPPRDERDDLRRFLTEWQQLCWRYQEVAGRDLNTELSDEILNSKISESLLNKLLDSAGREELEYEEKLNALDALCLRREKAAEVAQPAEQARSQQPITGSSSSHSNGRRQTDSQGQSRQQGQSSYRNSSQRDQQHQSDRRGTNYARGSTQHLPMGGSNHQASNNNSNQRNGNARTQQHNNRRQDRQAQGTNGRARNSSNNGNGAQNNRPARGGSANNHQRNHTQNSRQANNQGANRAGGCRFCQDNHLPTYCTRYTTPEARKQRLRDLGLCVRCSGRGHEANNCVSNLRCSQCQQQHIKPLCPEVTRTLAHSITLQPVGQPAATGWQPAYQQQQPSYVAPGPQAQVPNQPVANVQWPMHSASTPVNLNQISTTDQGPVPSTSAPVNLNPPSRQETITVGPRTVYGNSRTVANIHQIKCTTQNALPTLTGTLCSQQQQCTARIFLDCGAQMTFVHPEIVQKLGLKPIATIPLALTSYTESLGTRDYEIVRLFVKLGIRRVPIQAVVDDRVGQPIETRGYQKTVEKLREFGIHLADSQPLDKLTDVRLIVGTDNFDKFITGVTEFKKVHMFTTPEGHVLYGPLPSWAAGEPEVKQTSISSLTVNVQRIAVQETALVDPPIENLWNLDSIGIKTETFSHLEEKAVSIFNNTVRYEQGQYIVDLPFKTDDRPAPNYNRAYAQLMSMKKQRNSKFFVSIQDILDEYEQDGFIEVVPQGPIVDGEVHYLPHHVVCKESSSTPHRIVFNASAKSTPTSKSLNEVLYTGPNLATKIYDMILSLRCGKYAVTADITKAFLRIQINPAHRDYCRFLWYQDATMSDIKVYRFRTVLFGATCSPFLLNQTLQNHFDRINSELSRSLKGAFYIDNLQKLYDSPQDIGREKPEIEAIMSQAGMPLAKWTTNAALGEPFLPQGEHDYLGITWDTAQDVLKVKMPTEIKKAIQSTEGITTKRRVVSLFATLYDPIGLLSPITIHGKLFIQRLWISDKKWDTPLTREQRDDLAETLEKYKGLATVKVPRNIMESQGNTLHIFTDASKKAFGAVAYVVTPTGTSNLLTSRSRVTPKKMLLEDPTVTIPKLELTALLMGCRLSHHLAESQPGRFQQLFVWTDAKVTLQWVDNCRSHSTYVLNRVQEIQQLASAHNMHLRYVPTGDNAADVVSRGTSVTAIKRTTHRWLHGPRWLTEPTKYPAQSHTTTLNVITVCIMSVREVDVPKIDFAEFTSFGHVIRTFGQLQRFAQQKLPEASRNKVNINPLRAAIKISQAIAFPRIIQALKGGAVTLQQSDKDLIHQKRLFLAEDGLLRCQTRLAHSDLDTDAKQPIFLDREDPLWRLIVLKWHERHLHTNVGTLLTLLRQRYWVGRMRQTIKKIVNTCLHCGKVQGRPYRMPPPPPLPASRLRFVKPFQVTGVDYASGFKVQDPHLEQVYLLLFTCTVTRAVALEVTETLTADEFILALRRFASRFGMPAEFISDNGSAFKATSRLLEEIGQSDEVLQYCQNNNVKWTFLTARSPWRGGFYERLIGFTKANLRKALWRKIPTLNVLKTLVCEAENVVNSRPLTFLGEDQTEEPLTPSHLLYGRVIPLAPQVTITDVRDPLYREETTLKKSYQHLTNLLQIFTQRWMKEYLCALRERHQYYQRQGTRQPQVGDLVLILLDERPRERFPMGVILQTYPGEDSVVRTVKVRTAKGTCTKPIVKIIPLEMQVSPSYFADVPDTPEELLEEEEEASEVMPTQEEPEGMEAEQPSTSRGHRPRRAAARAAHQRFQEWCD